MGDRQGRLNLCPFVGVDLNQWPTVYIRYRADKDVNHSINQSFTIIRQPAAPYTLVTDFTAGAVISSRLVSRVRLLGYI